MTRISGLFQIELGLDTPQAFVHGLLSRYEDRDPTDLARVNVIVNTGRMQRKIKDVLIQEKALLHPKIHLISDLSDLTGPVPWPKPQNKLSTRFELLSLVQKLLDEQPDLAARASQFDLADSLAALIDEMQGEDVAPDVLSKLNVTDQSGHWQRALAFVSIVKEYLSARSTTPDTEGHQRRVVEYLGQLWTEHPPQDPVILVGSTGSRGTTLALMRTIVALPQGCVIVPGYDAHMPSHAWPKLADRLATEDHPQARLFHVAQELESDISNLPAWSDTPPPCEPRNRLLSLALRPAPVTDAWLDEGPHLGHIDTATAGLSLIEAQSQRDEATAIALCMRDAIAANKTAALITPNRTLTRQVAATLDIWGIVPDDSGGMPLQQSPPGRLLRQVGTVLRGELKTSDLLAILKHPLTHSGSDRAQHLLLTRELELHLRNKSIPFPTLQVMHDWCIGKDLDGVDTWVEWISGWIAPDVNSGELPFKALLETHITLSETIARGSSDAEDGAAGTLWNEGAGRSAQATMARIQDAAPAECEVTIQDYLDVISQVLATEQVRSPDVPHPQALIWGTLEARVEGADVVILAGLNEGSWPEPPASDPWLNRALRVEAGLLLPERRIGLSAHDWQIAATKPTVVLSRSIRSEDAQTVPSRWLNRLLNLLEGLSEQGAPDVVKDMRARGTHWLELARQLEATQPIERAKRPSPRPPRAARPDEISVTDVKHLIRDAYAIYAKRILALRPLNPLDKQPDARLRGILFHSVMEQFIKAWPQLAPDDRKPALLRITDQILEKEVPWINTRLFWRNRVERIADWVIKTEEERQAMGMPTFFEIKGRHLIAELGITLTTQADRIDITPNNQAILYDYKTGPVPTDKVQRTFDKQLYLMAAIAEAGGFSDIGPIPVQNAAFIGLGSKNEVRNFPTSDEDVETAWEKFKTLLRHFQDPSVGYTSRGAMYKLDDKSDYDLLARFGEWDIDTLAEAEDLE